MENEAKIIAKAASAPRWKIISLCESCDLFTRKPNCDKNKSRLTCLAQSCSGSGFLERPPDLNFQNQFGYEIFNCKNISLVQFTKGENSSFYTTLCCIEVMRQPRLINYSTASLVDFPVCGRADNAPSPTFLPTTREQ